MRANPFHSYRGFRYYTTAGVYRLSLPDGSKEAFGAKRGGLPALQNYVDAYIDELAADQSLARNPRPLSKAEKAQRAKKRPVTPRSLALLSHIERRGAGAGAGKHHTRTRDEETGRARRPKHGGREAYVERENPKTLDFVVKAGWYGSGYPDLDDATLERAKREIGATRLRRTTEGNVPAVVFSVPIPDWASGSTEGVARSIESILNRYGRVSGLFQSPDPFYVSRAKSRKARPTDEEMDAGYAEMNVKEARRKAAQKRPPPEVTPRKRLAAKGSARPKYPLDLRANPNPKNSCSDDSHARQAATPSETLQRGNLTYIVLRCPVCGKERGLRLVRKNPLSGKEGLHIVAKRRSPSKRGPEFSFSYSTRTPVMGVAEGKGGKPYATRTYMEDWKADAEDLLSEYDAGYYADADITIFALDARGVEHPLTLSAVRSMAKSGSLPARRAANPRYR